MLAAVIAAAVEVTVITAVVAVAARDFLRSSLAGPSFATSKAVWPTWVLDKANLIIGREGLNQWEGRGLN